jgi:DNA-directed RNA polymerase specialized sigma24 family protein
MRSVTVSRGRERAPEKRGAGQRPLTLSTDVAVLAQVDARLAQVVQMRCFGGYSEHETAETLDVTERTVQRPWLKTRRCCGRPSSRAGAV